MFFIQTGGLQLVRDQLVCSDLSSEVQHPSETSGPESQRFEGFRSGAAERSSGESRLQTGGSQVSKGSTQSLLVQQDCIEHREVDVFLSLGNLSSSTFQA